MKKVVLGILILIMSSFVFSEEKYEITEVDIFSLKKFLSSTMITVRGVSIENNLQEAMRILGKTDADLEKKDEYWWLEVEPGFKIRADKKKRIEAIVIYKEFKENLHGKAARFFDLEKTAEMVKFLKECLGKPDDVQENSVMGVEADKIIYLNGFRFIRLFDRESLTIGMELTTVDKLLE